MPAVLSRTVQVKVVGDMSGGVKAVNSLGAATTNSAGKMGSAFSRLGGTLSSAFGGALAPVAEGLNVVGEGLAHISEHGAKTGAVLTAVGGAATAMGAVMVASSAADVQAHAQLKAAVEATGASYEELEPKFEAAIKAQAKFGNDASQTQNALNNLTLATHNPEKALEALTVASDVAAKKHISLAAAADIVGKAYNGNKKILKEFGITSGFQVNTEKGLEKATKIHATAVSALTTAQQKLADLEAVDAGKKKLSISQQIQLRKAHEAVATAQGAVAASAKGLASAQLAASHAGDQGSATLSRLGAVAKGQASASVSGLAGQFRVFKTQIENSFNEVGAKWGPALTAAGPPLLIAGQVISSGIVGKIGTGIGKAGRKIGELGGNLGRLAQHIPRGLGSVFSSLGSSVASAASSVASLTATVAVNTATWVSNTAALVWNKIQLIAQTVWSKLVAAAKATWAAIQVVLNIAMAANPIGIIIIAIIALVGIIVLIATKTTWFQTIWKVAMAVFTTVTKAAATFIMGAVRNIIGFFTGLVTGVAKAINAVKTWIWGIVLHIALVERNILLKIISIGRFFLVTLPGYIRQGVAFVVSAVINLPGRLFAIFNSIVTKVASIGRNVVSGIWNGISGAAGWLYGKVMEFAQGIITNIKHQLGIASPSKVGHGLGQNFGMSFGSGMLTAVSHVKNATAMLVGATDMSGLTAAGVGAGVASGFVAARSSGDTVAVPIYFNLDGQTLVKGLAKINRRTGQATGSV